MSAPPPNKPTDQAPTESPHRPGSDVPFYLILGVIGGVYVVLLLGMLLADVAYMVSSDSANVVALPAALEWARPAFRPVLPILALPQGADSPVSNA